MADFEKLQQSMETNFRLSILHSGDFGAHLNERLDGLSENTTKLSRQTEQLSQQTKELAEKMVHLNAGGATESFDCATLSTWS